MGLAAAIGIAEVAFSVTAILESVAVVGAAVSVVGMVTKDKTLSMIGAGLGLVGGIGALASGALGLSGAAMFGAEAAAPAAGDIAATAAEGALGSASAGFDAAPDVVGALSGEGAAAFDPAAAFAADPTATLGASAAGEAPTGLINASTTTAEDAGAAASAGDAADAAATLKEGVPRAPFDLGSTSGTTGQTITSAGDPATGLTVGLPGATDTGNSVLGKLMDYATAHPMVAFGAVQGASSLLSGWTSTLTPAQVAALNAQAAANQAATNLSTRQQANLAMPKAVASSAPVTGAPQTLVPAQQQPGFINQPAPAAPITGRVAA